MHHVFLECVKNRGIVSASRKDDRRVFTIKSHQSFFPVALRAMPFVAWLALAALLAAARACKLW